MWEEKNVKMIERSRDNRRLTGSEAFIYPVEINKSAQRVN